MSNALQELAVELGRDVEQVFYITGHSFMEKDGVHSLIEQKVKPQQVFSVEEYIELTKSARKNEIETCCCDHTFFKDYTELKFSSIRPKSFKVKDIKLIRYCKDGVVKCKTSYTPAASWIQSYAAEREEDFDKLERPQAFDSRLPITSKNIPI